MFDINKFYDVFIENWKDHADAPIPPFNEEKINVYEFNNDKYEPLRAKYYDLTIEDNIIKIHWISQERWYDYDIYGMKKEFKRWAKYWANIFKHMDNNADNEEEEEKIKFKVKVEDRDGHMKDTFQFTIKL